MVIGKFWGSQTGYQIRAMKMEDLPAILFIEQTCHVEPWHASFFIEELARAHSFIFVAEKNGPEERGDKIVGYICFWKVADEVQVFNLAVAPAHRRQGIGRTLLLKALAEGYQRRARLAVLEVRLNNKAAESLYRSIGFKAAGIRPHYYREFAESAVLMELEMTPRWRKQWLGEANRDSD